MRRWEDALKRLFHSLKRGESLTCTIGETLTCTIGVSHTCFEAVEGGEERIRKENKNKGALWHFVGIHCLD